MLDDTPVIVCSASRTTVIMLSDSQHEVSAEDKSVRGGKAQHLSQHQFIWHICICGRRTYQVHKTFMCIVKERIRLPDVLCPDHMTSTLL